MPSGRHKKRVPIQRSSQLRRFVSPLHCPHELWTSKPAFTPLSPGPLYPQAKLQRSIEKLITSLTAIFAKLATCVAQPTKT